ncbi:MAG: response regulator [bacterium]
MDNQEFKAKRVLIVDDDSEFRRSLSKILKKAGYEVSIASSGLQARQMLSHESYPLILSDIHMPGISGLTLLKEIHKESPQSKVIIITVDGESRTYEEAMMAGAFAFLNKPVKMKKILTYANLALRA